MPSNGLWQISQHGHQICGTPATGRDFELFLSKAEGFDMPWQPLQSIFLWNIWPSPQQLRSDETKVCMDEVEGHDDSVQNSSQPKFCWSSSAETTCVFEDAKMRDGQREQSTSRSIIVYRLHLKCGSQESTKSSARIQHLSDQSTTPGSVRKSLHTLPLLRIGSVRFHLNGRSRRHPMNRVSMRHPMARGLGHPQDLAGFTPGTKVNWGNRATIS